MFEDRGTNGADRVGGVGVQNDLSVVDGTYG